MSTEQVIENLANMDRTLAIRVSTSEYAGPRRIALTVRGEGVPSEGAGITVDALDVVYAMLKALPGEMVVIDNPTPPPTGSISSVWQRQGDEMWYDGDLVTLELAKDWTRAWAGVALEIEKRDNAKAKAAEEREARIVKLGRAMEFVDGVCMSGNESEVGDKYRDAAEAAIAALEMPNYHDGGAC